MGDKLKRDVSSGAVVVASGAALSDAIDMRDYSGGVFITPASLNATTKIAFQVSDAANGTFIPLYTSADALEEVTVTLNASRAYALPEALFGASFVKLWCQASGTGVNQTGAKTFTIMLKG